jgi:putative transposase
MDVLAQRPASLSRSRACAALGLSRTGTYPRTRRRPEVQAPARRHPRALSERERAQIRDLAHAEHYRDASLAVIHARELNAGHLIASLSTFYRVLRADGETAERRLQRAPYRHAVPHILADRPHACWSWDISKLALVEPGRYLNLYLILDLYSRFVVAWMISAKENAALAKHLFSRAFIRHAIPPGQLIVHQDRGAPMIAVHFRDLLHAFGVQRSYSRPRVSNDNAASESLFKTLKYSPGYPGRFRDIDHARRWMAAFIADYQQRPHEGIAFYSPADVFYGRIETIHARRQGALDAHYAAHPQRYPNGAPAAKRPPAVMAINPKDALQAAEEIVTTTRIETVNETPVHLSDDDNVH